ncbi:hypothetical protein SD77_4104 [Bacillus badius]|uniref:Uncharacterized protein n=1 Tax=Bacillus badius TaxID=1455 RepID=A0ABR5AUI9_BACBA|nr:hypothetical protein SD77_4104 [Bacillus badius]
MAVKYLCKQKEDNRLLSFSAKIEKTENYHKGSRGEIDYY